MSADKAVSSLMVVDGNLVGLFPDVLDFSGGNLSSLDLSSERSLCISGSSVVKRLIIPSDAGGLDFLCIEDLSNLEEILMVGDQISPYGSLQWMYIGHVPSLKRVSLTGHVRSLEIEDAMMLSDVDVSGVPELDLFKVSGVPKNFNINVLGCPKIRGVVGIDGMHASAKELSAQIDTNQKGSRRDGVIYEKMTFSDLDVVVDLINEGVKALSRKGLLCFEDDDSLMGRYYLLAYDPKFKPYTFRVLEPLEPVYTGGTGETYAYVFVQRYVSTEDYSVEDDEGAGNRSPEDCLRYMLHWTRMELSGLDGIGETSDEQLLQVLRSAIVENAYDVVPDYPVRISQLVDPLKVQSIAALIDEVGMVVSGHEIDRCIYVYPESGIPDGERVIARSAALCVRYSTAVKQLTGLRGWFLGECR